MFFIWDRTELKYSPGGRICKDYIYQDLRILLLLPAGEGGDEGIKIGKKFLIFNPLTLALSLRERGHNAQVLLLKLETDVSRTRNSYSTPGA